MFKKAIVALAIAASASFATWDYYPIPDSSNGSAEAGLYYDKDHRWSQAGLKLGARLTLLKNFEFALIGWGYQFWNETDCSGCINGGDGLRDMTVGARFEIAPMVTAFLDLNLPVGREEYDGEGTNPPSNGEFSIYAGAQFSVPTKLQGFKFGTEGGILWGFEHDNHERGLDIHLGAEGAFTIKNTGLTPYAGFLIKFRLSESVWYDNKDTEHGYADRRSRQYNLWLGASYAVAPFISIKGELILRNEKYKGVWDDNNPHKLGGDATGLYMGAVFDF